MKSFILSSVIIGGPGTDGMFPEISGQVAPRLDPGT
jgi:hypothetical protein